MELRWTTLDIFDEPDDALECWYTYFTNILYKHEPIRIMIVKHIYKPEWLTAYILKAIAKRNALKKGNELVNYKFWRNKVLSLIRISKRTFYMREIEKNRCDTRKL